MKHNMPAVEHERFEFLAPKVLLNAENRGCLSSLVTLLFRLPEFKSQDIGYWGGFLYH